MPSWSCTRSPVTPMPSARGPGPSVEGLVGRAHRSRRGHRHGPVLRRLPERAGRLPGHDGPGLVRCRRAAVRLTLPGDHHPRSGGGGGALADQLGIARWAGVVGGSMGGMRVLEWCVGAPSGWHVPWCWPSVRRPRPIRSPCVPCRSVRFDPIRRSTAATTTSSGPSGRRPVDCPRDRALQLPDR